MKILTPEEAAEEGYERYAHHLPHIDCPARFDSTIYCMTCAALSQFKDIIELVDRHVYGG